MRKLIVFGNGIGMAQDPDFFRLENLLRRVWDDPKALDDAQKGLVQRCLSADGDVIEAEAVPRSEEQLGTLQRILAACDEILSVERDGGGDWLSEEGRRFPSAIRSFIHRVAAQTHAYGGSLPEDFTKPLIDHITAHRSHVAVLNYDKLLYEKLCGSPVMENWDCLLDGFSPFSSDRLDRRTPERQCYYLHLHGSPLYVTREDGKPSKERLRNLDRISGHESTHLVLTHFDWKSRVIAASPILREYWKRFREVLPECNEVVPVRLFRARCSYEPDNPRQVRRRCKGRGIRGCRLAGRARRLLARGVGTRSRLGQAS